MSTRGKRSVWITEHKTALHQERANLLNQSGQDVVFLSDIDALDQTTEESRPTSVILDTRSTPAETDRMIAAIANLPSLSGARCVLNILRQDDTAERSAMSANFRDLIPWSISTTEWLARIQYATAPRPVELPKDLCAFSINQLAILRVPGRLVWINETHLRLECRGAVRPGNILHVTGNLAAAFGVPHITLTVTSVHKDRLLYRFSQAIEATWQVPAAQNERAGALIRRLQLDHTLPRVRVFVAVNRSEWRRIVIDSLNPNRHELNIALQRANLVSEVTYFSPDIVILDDRVANNLKNEELSAMFEKLAPDVPVLILGTEADTGRIQSLLPGRPLFQEPTANFETLPHVIQRYKVTQHMHLAGKTDQVCHILPDHPWSPLELEVRARIQSLNPKSGTLALPFPLGPFALARMASPLLRKSINRDPYIKITNEAAIQFAVYNPQFAHSAEFFLADVDQEERRKIAHILMTAVGDYYGKHYGYAVAAPTPQKPVAVPATHNTLTLDVPSAVEIKPAPMPEINEPKSFPPETLDTKLRRGLFRREIELDFDFDIRKHIDPVVAKAVGVFAIAATLTGFLLYAATHVDESTYKDHGKEYGEFFKRMKDPDYSKANPAAKVREKIKGTDKDKDKDPDNQPTNTTAP